MNDDEQQVVIKQMNRRAMNAQRALRTGEAVHENGFRELVIDDMLQTAPHPHVVHILNTRTTPTECQIVMAYCPQGELYPYIAQNQLSWTESLHLFRQIVHGLRCPFGSIVGKCALGRTNEGLHL